MKGEPSFFHERSPKIGARCRIHFVLCSSLLILLITDRRHPPDINRSHRPSPPPPNSPSSIEEKGPFEQSIQTNSLGKERWSDEEVAIRSLSVHSAAGCGTSAGSLLSAFSSPFSSSLPSPFSSSSLSPSSLRSLSSSLSSRLPDRRHQSHQPAGILHLRHLPPRPPPHSLLPHDSLLLPILSELLP